MVFDAPSGEAGWNWFRVQPAVAAHTRACVFDRAGHAIQDDKPEAVVDAVLEVLYAVK